MASKRTRENSSSRTPSPSPLLPSAPPFKASRVLPHPHPHPSTSTTDAAQAVPAPLLCTLPPTCNPPAHRGTPLAGTAELEAHYATHHAHVCAVARCACVFPEARLLELHQTECHDPIAAMRKERGEKIFACHLASCQRYFLTPKARRLHLISAHGFPKEYFFAVTNKGVGGLLRRWGEGASLLRGKWTPREARREVAGEDDSDDVEENEMGEEGRDEGNIRDLLVGGTSFAQPTNKTEPRSESKTTTMPARTHARAAAAPPPAPEPDPALSSLSTSLSSLSLVPRSIRFGRGGQGSGGRGRSG